MPCYTFILLYKYKIRQQKWYFFQNKESYLKPVVYNSNPYHHTIHEKDTYEQYLCAVLVRSPLPHTLPHTLPYPYPLRHGLIDLSKTWFSGHKVPLEQIRLYTKIIYFLRKVSYQSINYNKKTLLMLYKKITLRVHFMINSNLK